MLECQTCRGTYNPVLADGTLYFHACPPLAAHEIAAALAAKTITLPPADAARLKAAQDADAANPVPPDQVPRAAIVLAGLSIDRANARDENVTGDVDKNGRALIKRAGAGTRTVPPRP